MPLITQKVQTFQYTGPSVQIGSLDYLPSVRRITKVSANGQGYTSVLLSPASAFPPFSSLETGEYYIFFSLTTGYSVDDGKAVDPEVVDIVFANTIFDS